MTVDVFVTITSYDTLYDPNELSASVVQSIKDYINGLTTGSTVYVVGIANAVHDTDGIIDFQVTNPISNQLVLSTQKPVAGNIIVSI